MAGVGRVFKVKVQLKHWVDSLRRVGEENTIEALWIAGMQIKEVARLMAPRETGALMNSIALVAQHKSTYSGAVMQAMRMRPGVAVQSSPSAGKNEVYIVPVVGYAGHQEFGTIFHGAQPFLIPALRAVGPKVLGKGFQSEVFGKYKKYPPITKRWTF